MATTKTKATLDDLYAVEYEDGKYELVDGELVYIMPPGFLHNRVAGSIFEYLRGYERETRSGYATMDGINYTAELPGRSTRTFNPDAAYTHGRPPITPRFIEGAPLFAVEVRSPSDYGPKRDAAYAEKRADYFAAGTLVVWDVDPRGRTIRSHRADAPDSPTTFRDDDTADAEPALPGWRVAVRDVFPPEERPLP